jgi:hypothetical protein
MNNNLARLKLRNRLNKLSSFDFTNLECWQEFEILNKAQIQWVRRQLHGINQVQEGDEESKRRIDDLNILLTSKELKTLNKDIFFESEVIPKNYLEFKKVVIIGEKKGCDSVKRIRTQLVPEADVEHLLANTLTTPSFKWGETFISLFGNKIRVWTNGDFLVKKLELNYYRFPKKISSLECLSIDGKVDTEQPIEFKDDIAEIIIDEAASIAAGDMKDISNYQRLSAELEKQN